METIVRMTSHCHHSAIVSPRPLGLPVLMLPPPLAIAAPEPAASITFLVAVDTFLEGLRHWFHNITLSYLTRRYRTMIVGGADCFRHFVQ